jgi:hypothetical protein
MDTIKSFSALSILLFLSSCSVAGVDSAHAETASNEFMAVARDARSILTDQLRPLASSPAANIPASITDRLLSEVREAEQLALDITSERVANKQPRVVHNCDIFMMSVSLGGLRDHLEKYRKCVNNKCDSQTLEINRDVMYLQIDQLESLIEQCLREQTKE